MNTNFGTVSPHSTIADVARIMRDLESSIVLVCHDDTLLGMISEHDIVVNSVARSQNPEDESAELWLKNIPPILHPTDEVIEAARKMVDSGMYALPVVKGNKLVGLITVEDLARENLPLAAVVFANSSRQKSVVI